MREFADHVDWSLGSNQVELAAGLESEVFGYPEAELDEDGLITCPLIPLRDMVMYPRIISPLFIGRERSIQAANAATATNHRVLVVAQRDGDVYDPRPEDLYAIGTEVVIGRAMRMPEGMLSVLAQGRSRVEIVEFVQWEPFVKVRARPLAEIEEPSAITEALMRAVLALFEKCVQLSRALPEDMYVYAMNIEQPGWLADLVASALRLELGVRQELLEMVDAIARLQRVSLLLAKELDLLELEDRIHSEVQEQVDRSQREYFLREQLKAIQTELGEADLLPRN